MAEEMIGDVELRPGEVSLNAWRAQTATWGPFVSSGTLNLTNERLIWIRRRFNVIPGSTVIVKLDQIKTCVGDDGFNRHRVILTLLDGSERTFHVLVGTDGSTVADAINEARRKRGLLDA
jgi:hypothetical protein